MLPFDPEGTVTDRVVVPEPVTEVGENNTVLPLGWPLTANPTVWSKPPEGVTVIEYVAVPPPCRVTLPGVAEREKLPLVAAGLTVSVAFALVLL